MVKKRKMNKCKTFYTIEFQQEMFNHMSRIFEINLPSYPILYPCYLQYLDYLHFQLADPNTSNGGLQNIKEIYNAIKTILQNNDIDIPDELKEPEFFLDKYYSWLAHGMGGVYDRRLYSWQNSVTKLPINSNSDISLTKDERSSTINSLYEIDTS